MLDATVVDQQNTELDANHKLDLLSHNNKFGNQKLHSNIYFYCKIYFIL